MSIVDDVVNNLSGTSDLKKMFGAFCCRVFAYRDEILSPEKAILLETSALETKETEREQDRFKFIHRSVSVLLKTFTDSGKTSFSHKDSTGVAYLMAAMADEVFLNIEWDGKHRWEENMLETKFFGSQIAGDKIFDRINQLVSKADHLETEEAEIYLSMLLLGFKGKFRGSDEEAAEIGMYKRKLFNLITKCDKEAIIVAEYRLFQKEYAFTIPTIRRKLLPDGAIVTYLSVLFLFMFISVSTIVWLIETNDLQRLLSEISEIALREH